MGKIQKQVYDLVITKAGFKGRMRLAVMTGISSTKANDLPDTNEVINRLLRAAKEILNEDIVNLIKR